MEIKYISTYWGQDHLSIQDVIKRAEDAGFDGLELNIPMDQEFVDNLNKGIQQSSLDLIAQQWLPPESESPDEYKKRMSQYLKHLASVNPKFINSHTGKDYYSFDTNSLLIKECESVSEETGVKILHETHRGRFTHHAFSLLPYLEKYPNLALTADFSHFCCVSESLLEDQDDIIEKIIPHAHYIHARVGFDQSAQVNHPFAPEWKPNLNRFVAWWQKILDSARARGEKTFYICPEFGPFPYMPALPFTEQPISNQWEINYQMMVYLKKQLS